MHTGAGRRPRTAVGRRQGIAGAGTEARRRLPVRRVLPDPAHMGASRLRVPPGAAHRHRAAAPRGRPSRSAVAEVREGGWNARRGVSPPRVFILDRLSGCSVLGRPIPTPVEGGTAPEAVIRCEGCGYCCCPHGTPLEYQSSDEATTVQRTLPACASARHPLLAARRRHRTGGRRLLRRGDVPRGGSPLPSLDPVSAS